MKVGYWTFSEISALKVLMKESRTCKWENFSCNGKWKKFQLGKPQEYELFLGKPQEYELFFFVHSKQSCQASAFPLFLYKDVIGFKCILPSFSSFNFRRETCKNFDEAFNGKQRNMFFFLFHFPHHRLFLCRCHCRLYFWSFSSVLYFSLKPLPHSFHFLPHWQMCSRQRSISVPPSSLFSLNLKKIKMQKNETSTNSANNAMIVTAKSKQAPSPSIMNWCNAPSLYPWPLVFNWRPLFFYKFEEC